MDKHERRETIVVTGGSGFLGQHIVRQLLEQKLFPLQEIRIFDIQEFKWFPGMEPINNHSGGKLKPIKGDICQIDQLQRACRNATTVIHSAAHIDVSSLPDGKKLQLVNVKGTENVIQACIENDVERLVFTSTVDAYLSPHPFPTSNVTEAQVPTPTKYLMGPYGATKSKADRLVLDADNTLLQNGKRLRTCALRIPYMYGEGDERTRDLIEMPAKKKTNYPVGHDDHVVQKIYAGNAAWAHVLAVQKLSAISDGSSEPSPAGKSMFVGDDTPLKSLSAHFQPYIDGLGATNGFRIPFGLIYIVAAFMESISWLLQPIYPLRSNITRSSITFLRNNYTVSWQLARQCLGYTPIFSYDEGIKKSLVYLKESLNVS